MPLRRGFKAEAERLAKDIWRAMSLAPNDTMDAIKLAKHMGCIVRSADALVDIAKLEKLRRIQKNAFFACTFKLPDDRYAIVFNPLMSDTRRNSDVAHEVAHIVLGHVSNDLVTSHSSLATNSRKTRPHGFPGAFFFRASF